MSDEVKPVVPEVKLKKKTAQELMNANLDELTNEELERRAALVRASKEEADLQDIKERLADRDNKRTMKAEGFRSRGRELRKTEIDQKRHQDNCSHRKGGRGLDAIQKGGNASDYAVIRHLLPTNEWWQRCQRCGKTWRPPHVEDFKTETPEGREAFESAKRVYAEALAWPTDNIPSTGITFQHHSEDGDVSARKFVHDVMKDSTLR